MIERIVVTGAHDSKIIRAGLQARVIISDLDATLAALAESLFAAVDRCVRFCELQLQALRRAGRKGLAVKFCQKRFGVECVYVAGTALHKEENDAFGFGGEMRAARREGISDSRCMRQNGIRREQSLAV